MRLACTPRNVLKTIFPVLILCEIIFSKYTPVLLSLHFQSEKMSTGKRLAKRSILGTRVAAPAGDGLFLTGIIQAVKTCEDPSLANRFSVRFDDDQSKVSEFLETNLIGPGFKSVTNAHLQAGQLVYVTHCQREMAGRVVRHDFDSQDVIITLSDVSTLFYLYSKYTLRANYENR